MNVGQTLSHYVLEEKIGDGGFGDVFRARDLNTGLEVAIKCSRPNDTENQLRDKEQRFLREVSCISKLRHPGIVQMFDYGALPDGTLFLVMEYVSGRNLEVLIKQDAPFSYAYASDIVLQILDALSEAHNQGIVHRDLKPANIMLVRQGLRSDVVKLLDFGIAKAFNGTEPDLTRQNFQNGAGFGTPQYMPPEQFYGKKIGPHSDLYAVGLVFYELLTGKQAFNGKNLSEIIEKQLKSFPEIPPPFCEGPLDNVFRRALAKQISMRYTTAADMYCDIDAITRYQSPYLKKYLNVSGAALRASLDEPEDDEVTSTAVEQAEYTDYSDEDATNIELSAYSEGGGTPNVSECNTLIFTGEARQEPSSISIRDSRGNVHPVARDLEATAAIPGYDEFADPLEMVPTDDMSRVNPSVAAQAARNATGRRDAVDVLPPTVPNLRPLPNQPPIPGAMSANNRPVPNMPPQSVNRVQGTGVARNSVVTQPPKPANNYNDYKESRQLTSPYQAALFRERQKSEQIDIRTNAVPARPDLANLERKGPIGIRPNAPLPPPARPRAVEVEEDLPPVFHEQRTHFLQGNNLRKVTSLGDESLFARITYRLKTTTLGAKFLNSAFYRTCRHGHHRMSIFIDKLYDEHFVELVVCVCLLIILLTFLVILFIMP